MRGIDPKISVSQMAHERNTEKEDILRPVIYVKIIGRLKEGNERDQRPSLEG
jgi:hypothetical protein